MLNLYPGRSKCLVGEMENYAELIGWSVNRSVGETENKHQGRGNGWSGNQYVNKQVGELVIGEIAVGQI